MCQCFMIYLTYESVDVCAGQVDDVVDASVVHGLCGLWGMMATGLFTTKVGYARAYDEVRV